ncbi:MAG TPA: hypothetical protein VK615_00905, partial [Candidatus Binatia bacterium]|nr:hypothetical protein [Candidatus Binatia bacterium]
PARSLALAFLIALTTLSTLLTAQAASTALPLRWESVGTCIYNANTTQTVETVFGSNPVRLPFTGTNTYDFYSPAIIVAPALTTADSCGGELWVTNSGSTDINVKMRLKYYDYDPATGLETLIAGGAESPPKNVSHFSTQVASLPPDAVTVNITPVAGHLLHVQVTVWLNSGTLTSASIVFNGPNGSKADSVGLLPSTRGATWQFQSPATPPDATVTAPAAVWANSTGNTASVPSAVGATYAWTITGGAITAGQGTPQITWSAGSAGSVNLGATVTRGCSSIGSAVVSVSQQDVRFTSISCSANGHAHVVGLGTGSVTYVIQATTDLVNWQNLGTATADASGVLGFEDINAPNFAARYYRAALP